MSYTVTDLFFVVFVLKLEDTTGVFGSAMHAVFISHYKIDVMKDVQRPKECWSKKMNSIPS